MTSTAQLAAILRGDARHVHFATDMTPRQDERTRLMRERLEREREEALMLKPFQTVLEERYPLENLEQFILWRATLEPGCIREWLATQQAGGPREGIVRHLRDQMFPIVPEETFIEAWNVVTLGRHEDLFWMFVCAMFLDEGVMRLVRQTWRGSDRSFDCIIEYFQARFLQLMEAPFDPGNANTILVRLWKVVQMEFCSMAMRKMILNGKLRPLIVPLSRNAHRERRKEIRQEQHEAAVVAACTAPPATLKVIVEEVVEASGIVAERAPVPPPPPPAQTASSDPFTDDFFKECFGEG